MAIHHIRGVHVRTHFTHAPIFWSAVDDDTYDVDCDQDGFFSTSPIGHGATERDAINDLLMQMVEIA